MADIFAQLVAEARIDTANFDRQLAIVKSQLSGFSAASLGNITLKALEIEINNATKSLGDFKDEAKISTNVIQGALDSIHTTIGLDEVKALKEEYSVLADLMDQVLPGVGNVIIGAARQQIDQLSGEGIPDLQGFGGVTTSSMQGMISHIGSLNEKTGFFKSSIDRAIAAVKKLGFTFETTGKKGEGAFSGITGRALKAVAIMGTVELGLGLVNVGGKAFTGSIEDSAEAIKQLPAGIGPVARQIEEIADLFTGVKREAESINKTVQILNQNFFLSAELQGKAYGDAIDKAIYLLSLNEQIGRLRLGDDEESIKRQQTAAAAEERILQFKKQVADASKAQALAQAEFSDESQKTQATIDNLNKAIKGTNLDNLKITYASQIKALETSTDLKRQGLVLDQKSLEELQAKLPLIEEINAREKQATEAAIAKDKKEKQDTAKKEILSLQESFRALFTTADQLVKTSGLNELDSAIAEVMFNAKEDAEEAKKLFEEANKLAQEFFGKDLGGLEPVLVKIEEAAQSKIKTLRDKAAKEEQERQEKLLQDRLKRETDLATLVATKRLRLAGDERGAEIEALKRQFTQDFFNAQTIREKVLLAQNLGLDLEEANKSKGPERQDLRARFEDTVARLNVAARGGQAGSKQDIRDDERNKTLKEIAKGNKELIDIVKNNPGIAVFGY